MTDDNSSVVIPGETIVQAFSQPNDSLLSSELPNTSDTETTVADYQEAISQGKINKISVRMIQLGLDVNTTTLEGKTCLHSAAEERDFHKIRWLIAQDADVTVKDQAGWTVTLLAARQNQFNLVKWLVVTKHVDVADRSPCGFNIIDFAVNNHNMEFIPWIINFAVETGVYSLDELTGEAIFLAARLGKYDIIKMSAQRGVNIHRRDKEGWTVLDHAVFTSDVDTIEWLILFGLDVNNLSEDGQNILHRAVSSGKIELVKLFIYKDLNINLKDTNGCSPMLLAAKQNKFSMINILTSVGGNFYDRDSDGWTVLHYCIFSAEKIKFEMNHKEINVNIKTDDGQTLLHYAASVGNLDFVQSLKETMVDINARDSRGRTPLLAAAATYQFEVVKCLLDFKFAEINVRDDKGWTILDYAISAGDTQFVSWLLKKGSDVRVKSTTGDTTLHKAVLGGHSEMVRLLINTGVNLSDRNKQGFSPMELAVSAGHLEIARALIENGSDVNVVSSNGTSLLSIAVEKDHANIVKLLLKSGAELDKRYFNYVAHLAFDDWDMLKWFGENVGMSLPVQNETNDKNLDEIFNLLDGDELNFEDVLSKNLIVTLGNSLDVIYTSERTPQTIPAFRRNGMSFIHDAYLAHDDTTKLISLYCLNGGLEKCTSVKFILSFEYQAMEDDEENFLKLIKRFSYTVEDFQRFESSVGLLITFAGKDEENFDTITTIVGFLEKLKEHKEVSEEIQRVINTLLSKTDDSYYKILTVSKLEDEFSIENVFNWIDNLHYTNKSDIQFKCYLQDMRETIKEMTQKASVSIIFDMINMTNDIKDHYTDKIDSTSCVYQRRNVLNTDCKMFLKLIEETPSLYQFEDFLFKLYSYLNKLNIRISEKHLSSILHRIVRLDLLWEIGKMNQQDLLNNWSKPLNSVVKHLSDAILWYDFLTFSYLMMSTLDIQTMIKKYRQEVSRACSYSLKRFLTSIFDVFNKNLEESVKIHALKSEILEFLDEAGRFQIPSLDNSEFNGGKFEMGRTLVNFTLGHQNEHILEDGQLTVRGKYVFLSEVVAGDANTLDIFALNTVFIDKDIQKPNDKMQISIIAPKIVNLLIEKETTPSRSDMFFKTFQKYIFPNSKDYMLKENNVHMFKVWHNVIIKEKEPIYSNSAFTFNKYKEYVLENYQNELIRYDLDDIYQELCQNKNIIHQYNTLGFVDELLVLEKSFANSPDSNIFLKFYLSLSKRVTHYVEYHKNELPIEEEKVLNYLHSAILSKICFFKRYRETHVEVNIEDFLKSAKSEVDNLSKSGSWPILTYREKYTKNVLNRLIEDCKEMTLKKIPSRLSRLKEKLEGSINVILKEIGLLLQTPQKVNMLSQKKNLKGILVLRRISGILRTPCLLGEIVLAFCLSNFKTIISSSDSEKVVLNVTKAVEDICIEKYQLVNKEISNLLQKMRAHPGDLFGDEEIKLAYIKSNLLLAHKDNPFNLQAIDKWVRQYKDTLRQMKDNPSDIIIQAEKTFKLAEVLGEEWYDDSETVELTKAVERNDKRWNLSLRENNLNDLLFPAVKKIIPFLTKQTMAKPSTIVDEVTQCLRSVRKEIGLFKQMIEGEETVRCFLDQLVESLVTVEILLEHVQNFEHFDHLLEQIRWIKSPQFENISVTNPELSAASYQLHDVISSNISLHQYSWVTDIFGQVIFPFGNVFLEQLPTAKFNKRYVSAAFISQTEVIKMRFHSLTELYTNHKHLFTAPLSKQTFHVWKNATHKECISKLLSGEEIVLKSNVTPTTKQALKFNVIEIALVSSNSNFQEEFEQHLLHLHVNMTHYGNSYYRCGNKVYVIASEKKKFTYSMAERNGNHRNTNETYNQVKEAHPVLSPYATWIIQLVSDADWVFEFLKQYEDDIDVELNGYGHYVENVNAEELELETYYKVFEMLNFD